MRWKKHTVHLMACKRNSNLGFWMLFFSMVSKKQCKEKVSHESNASHIPNIPQDIFLSPMDQKKQKTSHYYELGCNSTLPRMESWKMKGFVQASGSLQNMTKILVAIACWVSKFASQPYTPKMSQIPQKNVESWFEPVWPGFQFFLA